MIAATGTDFTSRIGIAGIAIIFAGLIVNQWISIASLGDRLSPIADPWTEADTIRAGEAYAVQGFTTNAGLPDLCFGNQFENVGTKYLFRENGVQRKIWAAGALAGRVEVGDSDHFVYTHYPPGPHLIAGIVAATVGIGKIAALRVVPTVIGLAALLYLVCELAQSFGPLRSSLALVFLCSFPALQNMMHGVSYQGYSLAMLWLQLALSLRVSRADRISIPTATAFLVVGFAQGALGFDYVFLVAGAPFAVGLLIAEQRRTWRPFIVATAASTLGFGIAHVLHFLQVSAYLGGMSAALRDLTAVAEYRSHASSLDDGQQMPSRLAVLWDYLTKFTGLHLHFDSPALVVAIFAILVYVANAYLRELPIDRRKISAVGFALIVASGWVLVMPQHSAQHWHFIPRHYFLPVFIATVLVLSSFELPRRLSSSQFVIACLGVVPILLLIVRPLGNNPAAIAYGIAVLTSMPGLAAYVLTGGTLLVFLGSANKLRRAVYYAPLTYISMFAIASGAEDVLSHSGSAPIDTGITQALFVAPYALVLGYGIIALGWLSHVWAERSNRRGTVATDARPGRSSATRV